MLHRVISWLAYRAWLATGYACGYLDCYLPGRASDACQRATQSAWDWHARAWCWTNAKACYALCRIGDQFLAQDESGGAFCAIAEWFYRCAECCDAAYLD